MTLVSGRGSHCALGGSSEGFEQLEPRIVLSDTFYAWTGTEGLPGHNPDYDPRWGSGPDAIVGASDDGRFMWSEAATGLRSPTDVDAPYLVIDGLLSYLFETPGLGEVFVPGVSSNGIAFAIENAGEDQGRLFLLDLLGTPERDYLDASELTAPAEFDLSIASPVAISDSGGLVVKTPDGSGGGNRLWMIIDNQVRSLWDGRFIDGNASNAVVGYSWNDEPMFWTPGMDSPLDLSTQDIMGVADVNDAGEVLVDFGRVTIRGKAWESVPEMIAVWHDGQVQELGYGYEYDAETGWETWYQASGRDTSGMLLLEPFYYSPHTKYAGSRHSAELHDSAGEVHFLSDDVSLRDLSRLIASGAIVGLGAGWWEPIDPAELQSVQPGAPVTTWFVDRQLNTWSFSPSGRGLLLRQAGNGAVTPLIRDLRGMNGSDVRQEVLIHPHFGDVLIATYSSGTVSLEWGGELDSWLGTPIVVDDLELAGATVYTREDGTFVLANLTLSGELTVAFNYRTRSNLSVHFAEWGHDSPEFTGQLSAFSTTWSGQTIIGLDTNGDVQAAWWSPGMNSEFWTVSNLSEITGAPRLVGNIVGAASGDAFGHDGMVITGTDERGHLISLQWTVEAGVWSFTDLTAQTGGPVITSDSLLGQSVWGGVTLVARDTAGDIVTYWRTDDGWAARSVNEAVGGSAPDIIGPLSYFVSLAGERHIAGSTADGQVIDFRWVSDDAGWRWQNLTALVDV